MVISGTRGYQWDRSMCPDYRGVLISEVVLYTKATFGTQESVLIIEVSVFQAKAAHQELLVKVAQAELLG